MAGVVMAPPKAETVADGTATLVANGQVSLQNFRALVQNFTGILIAITDEVTSQGGVEWELDELDGGQAREQEALITFRGEAEEQQDVARAVGAYLAVGKALRAGAPIPYSAKVQRPANRIAKVLNGRVSAVHFVTREDDATVVSHGADRKQSPPLRAYGAITGRVQALSNRQGLRFTLYDSVYDKAVSCFLQDGQEDMMREAWGKRASVSGWLSRDPLSGRPLAIRNVSQVDVRPDVLPGGYRRAVGIAPAAPDVDAAEVVIRRLRDA